MNSLFEYFCIAMFVGMGFTLGSAGVLAFFAALKNTDKEQKS